VGLDRSRWGGGSHFRQHRIRSKRQLANDGKQNYDVNAPAADFSHSCCVVSKQYAVTNLWQLRKEQGIFSFIWRCFLPFLPTTCIRTKKRSCFYTICFCICVWLRHGWYGVRIPSGTIILFYKRSTQLPLVDHSPPSSSKIKNEWSSTSSPPIRLHSVDRDYLTFHPFLYKSY